MTKKPTTAATAITPTEEPTINKVLEDLDSDSDFVSESPLASFSSSLSSTMV